MSPPDSDFAGGLLFACPPYRGLSHLFARQLNYSPTKHWETNKYNNKNSICDVCIQSVQKGPVNQAASWYHALECEELASNYKKEHF